MKNEKSDYKFPAPYFPDWDEVSDEYEYRAFDSDGYLYYYETKPVLHPNRNAWKGDYGPYDKAGEASRNWASKIWRDSLEQRPQSQTKK